MKPWHVGLLVVGAALAGGVAVRMTQPQPLPLPVAAPATIASSVPGTSVPDPPAPPTIAVPRPLQLPASVASAPRPVFRQPPATPAPFVKPKPFPVAKAFALPAPEPYRQPPAVPAPLPAAIAEAAPQPVRQPQPAALSQPAALQLPAPRQVKLTTGTTLVIRMDESLSSDRSMAGDTFNASLAEPLVFDRLVIAERGARVTGRVIDSQKAGRVSGLSDIEIALSVLTTADGQRVAIITEPWGKKGDSARSGDAAKIGGGAALGAIIGAIAGGGTGAAIGAGIGGGAGVATVAATRGKPVSVPAETIIPFRLAAPVTITERSN